MTWAKIDDQFFYNKKVAQVDGPAKLLYLAGLVYCANQLTDGLIPEKSIKFIASTADVANCQEFARQLLDVGLWETVADGVYVHDYLEWNPTKEQVLHNREVRAASGKVGGLAKAAKSSKLLSKSLANGQQKSSKSLAKVCPVPVPVPVPIKERAASRPRNLNLDDPAVIAYRDMTHLTPNQIQREDIVGCVKNLDCWTRIVREWMSAGWKPGNVAGMLERYSSAAGSNGKEEEIYEGPALPNPGPEFFESPPRKEAHAKTATV